MENSRHLIPIALALAVAAAAGVGLAAWGPFAWILGVGAGSAAYMAAVRTLAVPRQSPASAARTRAEPGGLPALILNLPLAVILIDRRGRVLLMNGTAQKIFGDVPAETPLSTVIRSPALAEAVETARASGSASNVDFTLMRARERRDLVAHLRRFDDGAGPGPSVMILLEDHTRTARVEQMRRDFIANASHELRTPLASIAGFIETLSGPAAGDAKAQERFLPIMAAQAERMARLIDDLMSLNRIEMNEHVRPSGTVDLGAIVHDAAAAMAPQAEQAGVEITVEVPRRGLDLAGEQDELSQLFFNLLDNAIKYGSDGGAVTVSLAKSEPGRGRMIGITVSDEGQGIEREHIPRLTERFYRVSESRTAGGGGTGLGLSIVKHILSRHRGDLTIRSTPGKGSKFTAWLPRNPAPD